MLSVTVLLHLGNLTTPTVRNACLCDLARIDRVVVLDILRPHDTSHDQFADFEVDADFLVSFDNRLPFGSTCVTTPATLVCNAS